MPQNAVDSGAWDNFVSSQGLGTTSLAKYYLKEPPSGKQLSRVELEEILHELFQDFVATGSVSLPPGASVGDFSFAIRDEEGPVKEGLYMADKRSGKEERIKGSPRVWMLPQSQMQGWEAHDFCGVGHIINARKP